MAEQEIIELTTYFDYQEGLQSSKEHFGKGNTTKDLEDFERVLKFMLKDEFIEINLWSKVIKRYEDMGYPIPREPNRDGILTVHRGTKILVKICDLPTGSDVKIELECDYCHQPYKTPYKKYFIHHDNPIVDLDACKKCSYKKQSDVIKLKYGVNNVAQIPEGIDKRRVSKRKYNISDIAKEFEEEGLQLLSTEFISVDHYLEFVCTKHIARGIQKVVYKSFQRSVSKGCKYCGWEQTGNALRHSLEHVRSCFEGNGYELLSTSYQDAFQALFYRCRTHLNRIQKVSFDSFIHGTKCKYCSLEDRIFSKDNFPLSEIFEYLRSKLSEWKKESAKECNYKCVVTGNTFDDIHHLYNFHWIVLEALDELDLHVKPRAYDYSNEEMLMIINKTLERHYDYPLGVCLSRPIHKLYHSIYGYSYNTPEQFEEFKQRYFNSEFKDLNTERSEADGISCPIFRCEDLVNSPEK
ncbi:hypothetical protein E4K67_04265 [Desulfosporosinus fructosivorans]|uniref:Uncharacterized protein n=2 Tax=Desulfosporosinus fructosivorans TaxID=2018669 RepID=A0A4Z0RAT3_9FIRM|nr:hypothetical protein E4K67_04265 [Desulfosporosinus fructosivorans]